jgi:predicted porin
MKKILLGTSALIGAALLASAASAGEDPKVTIGGFSNFEAGWTQSDFDQNERNRTFRNDNEIHFNIAGKTDAGLGYGAEIDLDADIDGAGNSAPGSSSAGSTNSGVVAHRTYGWLQGDNWGHLEFGSNDGVARTLKVDASNIARATGGIDGDFKYFADVNETTLGTGVNGPAGTFTGLHTNNFITSPRLPVENGPADGFSSDLWGNDDKITYYTPRFSGFQLGVSYAPSLTNRGQLTDRVDSAASDGATGDIWEGGINYENQFDQVGVALAATGETAHTSSVAGDPHINDLGAWNVGGKLSYMGFSLAGSYGDWRDSLDINGTKADYWTIGGAYETGPFGASVTYLGSEDKGNLGQDNKFQDVSVGVDYKLAPGLTPYIEYTWYDIDPSNIPAADGNFENKGNVVIIGSELSF